jgi:hypothetical protein
MIAGKDGIRQKMNGYLSCRQGGSAQVEGRPLDTIAITLAFCVIYIRMPLILLWQNRLFMAI